MRRFDKPGALAGALAWAAALPSMELRAADTFRNPLWNGADPQVVQHEGHFFHVQAYGDRIEVSRSPQLTQRGERATVWTAPQSGWNTSQVWAPELHRLDGKWYLYYAASTGRNAAHRVGVLEAATDDPQGQYIDRGMLYTGDDPALRENNRWAIDATVLQHCGQLYLAWSGWEDHRDIQYLYIAGMKDPLTVATPRVRLCANDTYDWERVGEDPRQRGLHEGPAFLQQGTKIFLVYSCSGSWQRTYKLGMLWADPAADLLDPKSWKKVDHPVFTSTPEVFGVGHCCFLRFEGREDWLIYHAKRYPRPGWEREVRMQRFTWGTDGFPVFGRPLSPDVEMAAPPPLKRTSSTSRPVIPDRDAAPAWR